MNKIISITIGGQVFQIVENAYEKLHQYIGKLNAHFSNDESGQEIIEDIESRMAELLTQKLSSKRQHIVLSDVEQVIETLGTPELLSGEENATKAAPQPNQERRLFRDPDNEKLAGVCGGLGVYFNTDPLWFRLGFVFLLLLFGSGILLYIVLAVVIPKANTAADKLLMHGEMPSLKNIEENIKQRAESLKKEFKDGEALSGLKRFFYLLIELAEKAFKTVGFFISVLVSVSLIVLLIIVLTGHPEFNFNNIVIPGKEGWMMFFDSTWELYAFKSLMAALLVLPAITFFIKSWQRHKAKKFSGPVNWALTLCWTIVVMSSIIFGIYIGKRFKSHSTVIETKTFNITSDTLTINNPNTDRFRMTWNNGETEEVNVTNHSGITFKPSKDSSFRINLYKKSRGIDRRTAKNLASAVSPEVKISGNSLRIPEEIVLAANTPWRAQRVKYQIEVPVGKYFYFTEVDHDYNSWDDDEEEVYPQEHLYKMTSTGRECVDCRK